MQAILEDLTPELVAAITERGEPRTLGGYGIRTADAYVKGVVACADDEVCRKIVLPNGFSWEPAEMLKAAAGRLVYSNESMVLEEAVKDADVDELAKANGVKTPPRTLMVFENWITTPLRDRDGDILRSEGAVIDKVMPLLWHHMPPMPAGKMLKVLSQDRKGVKVLTAQIDSELGGDAAALIEFGALRISHGFRPLEFEPMKDGGYDVTKFEIMEESLVTVPSNTEAVITAFSRDKLHDPLVKSWAKAISDARLVQVAGVELEDDCDGCDEDEELKGEKPYPNEHACRLRDPSDFDADSFRRVKRDSDGKTYFVIMGKLRGETEMTEQAYRYPKDDWTEAEARKHCKDHEGQRFEPATGEDEEDKMARVGADVTVSMELTGEARALLEELQAKSGRVLSAKNKSKLVKAAELLGEVLASSEVQGNGDDDKRSMTAEMLKWLDDGASEDEITALHELLGRAVKSRARAKRDDRLRALLRSTKR